MKPPKSEPYQRSTHRAALHAWVVAATAVACIGMPASALVLGQRDERLQSLQQNDLSPAQAAQRTAGHWLDLLRSADVDSALSLMRLPRVSEHEEAVLEQASALSDFLSHSGAVIEPVACRSSGHWALSAWRLDTQDASSHTVGLIEPITLYNPVADGLLDANAAWQVVPDSFADDPALAPLYNADHDELATWYRLLADGSSVIEG